MRLLSCKKMDRIISTIQFEILLVKINIKKWLSSSNDIDIIAL